ncbi:MAG: universal stress protein [Bacteroidales bacterium]|nr:universal stress protein [Bacteroidales bacterium]
MDFDKKNILVPFDFGDQAFGALNQAISISKHLQRQVVLLYVHQEKGALSAFFSNEENELFDKTVLDKLEETASEYRNSKIDIKAHLIRHNSIHAAIIEFANSTQSDLIVMGRGENANHPVIGANTHKVLRNSKVPVITVCKNCSVNDKYRTILLPLDLTKETRQKVNWGLKLAKIFNSKIIVVSALWSKYDPEIIGQLRGQMSQVEKFIEKQGVMVQTEIIESSSDARTLVPIILKYADTIDDLDLILIMTQQENSFTEFFLGSSATELIRNAEVPVMAIVPHETGQIIWGF